MLPIIAIAACGDDDEAAYCDSWASVRTAFAGFRDVDVVENGLEAVRGQLAELESSLDALRASSEDLLTDEAEALGAALDELAITLTSTDLPVDRRAEVRAAADEVDAAWARLVAQADVDCG
ncbi:MAG: hypothetical protein MUE78_10245 [Ilumatobacteraceae bacterium]|nr:hypothetical protein [Ilumatobacteraceae bacterium]